MLTKSNLRRLRLLAPNVAARSADMADPDPPDTADSDPPTQPPPWPRQLSAQRQELDRRIVLLASAQKAAEAAGKPVERLSEVIAEYERLSARMQACYASDRAELARLIADDDPRRSYTSPETETANSACEALREACAAARQGMPAAEAKQREAIAAVTAATRARDESLLQVAVEACEAIAVAMVERLSGYLALEAKLRSVVGELRARGDRGDNTAVAAAVRIEQLIRHAAA